MCVGGGCVFSCGATVGRCWRLPLSQRPRLDDARLVLLGAGKAHLAGHVISVALPVFSSPLVSLRTQACIRTVPLIGAFACAHTFTVATIPIGCITVRTFKVLGSERTLTFDFALADSSERSACVPQQRISLSNAGKAIGSAVRLCQAGARVWMFLCWLLGNTCPEIQ